MASSSPGRRARRRCSTHPSGSALVDAARGESSARQVADRRHGRGVDAHVHTAVTRRGEPWRRRGARRRAALLRIGDDDARAAAALPARRRREPGAGHAVQHSEVHALLAAAALVAELASHENVIGIKDSSGDRELFASYMDAAVAGVCRDHRKRSDVSACAVDRLGGGNSRRGAVRRWALRSTSISRASSGEANACGRRAQSRMTPLGAKIVGELGVAGVKAAMDRVGLVGGPVRSPLLPLDPAAAADRRELLQGRRARAGLMSRFGAPRAARRAGASCRRCRDRGGAAVLRAGSRYVWVS